MSVESTLASIKATSKERALLEFDALFSDEKLREIFTDNTGKIARLSNSMEDIAESYRLLGEAEACSEILAKRQAKRDKIEKKKKEWEKSLPKRRDTAILNLPTAVSANGQLVAAILEDEDGKTAEELAGWCDELGSLNEEELEKLLDGLTNEGIIEKEPDGHYHLIAVCENNLLYDYDAMLKKSAFLGSEEAVANARLVVKMMTVEGRPLAHQECADLQSAYQKMLAGRSEYKACDFDQTSWEMKRLMEKLVDAGLISWQFSIDGEEYYWFSLLGEGRN